MAKGSVKGSTRTDLRLTRAPANTPRGRLHRLAALGVRLSEEAKQIANLTQEDMARLRQLGKRGIKKLWGRGDRGSRMITHLCDGLDRATGALALLDAADVKAISDGLTITLVQLEVAESTIGDLKRKLDEANRDLAMERGLNNNLRKSLAAEQVRMAALDYYPEPWETRAAAVDGDVEPGRWEEPTRNSSMTEDQMRTLTKGSDDDDF